MSTLKVGIGTDVLTAARERIAWTFDTFDAVSVSFSGGKDSTVMLHLAVDEARRRGRRIAVLFIDLEAQYRLTIDLIEQCFADYADVIEPHWIALPLHLRNAVSVFETHWMCWDPDQRDAWVRQPPAMAITDPAEFPWFSPGMEFEELVPEWTRWWAAGRSAATMVGIRTDESLNRFRTIASRSKTTVDGRGWTTVTGPGTANVYPIFDWRTEDLWTYHARDGVDRPYNRLYDRMFQAGLTIHQMRICQPYGDDQRRGLWLFHLIEPETWSRVVARVNGANSGALYSQSSGNVNGFRTISLPDGLTWREFAEVLVSGMPPKTAEHFSNKIAVFVRWWRDRGYPDGIPDEADPKLEAARKIPSWRRIVRTLLKNDYWCKGLSFAQHRSDAYERYLELMRQRRDSEDWRVDGMTGW